MIAAGNFQGKFPRCNFSSDSDQTGRVPGLSAPETTRRQKCHWKASENNGEVLQSKPASNQISGILQGWEAGIYRQFASNSGKHSAWLGQAEAEDLIIVIQC